MKGPILALAGGVGGAKLALGLSRVLAPDELCIVVNTGDDFLHLGLHVSPDLDSVMYALAGMASEERGWGIEGESWNFMAALERIGGDTWFQLGDRDLATHIARTQLLRQGRMLSEVTRTLARRLGIEHLIVPMTDDPVRTIVRTAESRIAFQDYFVRQQCKPVVDGFEFGGAKTARPAPAFEAKLKDERLAGVIICPSNPYVSIDPILALPRVREQLGALTAPVVAVSPIVAGAAIKGPLAKMMAELGVEVSAASVARHYDRLVDGLIIHRADEGSAAQIESLGPRVLVADTVMNSLDDRLRLARDTVDFLRALDR